MEDLNSDVKSILEQNANGTIAPTAANFYLVFKRDPFFADIRFDTRRMSACRVRENGRRQYWEDADDALARLHIEDKYGLRNASKTSDAFLAFLSERHFDPLQDLIRSYKWDGSPHCRRFFIDHLGADDTAYVQEASRIFFAQAIRRTFEPGCKADTVLVLKGLQGCGKSTICRWLALEDEFYASVATIEGQKGYEAIQGKFICELEELLATVGVGSKKEAQVKAFISTQSDYYRRPYDRRSSNNPRHCVFIGTTNQSRFLTDPTGNRRWFPVECHSDGNSIYQREDNIRSEIAQCYAEMFNAFSLRMPLADLAPDRVLIDAIREHQEDSELEDYRLGLIEQYLNTPRKNQFVCCIEIWERALHGDKEHHQMSRLEANEIGELLRLKLNCQPAGKKHFHAYGTQHAYLIPDRLINLTER